MIEEHVVETTIDPAIYERLDTIVSQNEVIVSEIKLDKKVFEDCRTLNYYQLFTGILIVAVLGILAGQGFVKIFKR